LRLNAAQLCSVAPLIEARRQPHTHLINSTSTLRVSLYISPMTSPKTTPTSFATPKNFPPPPNDLQQEEALLTVDQFEMLVGLVFQEGWRLAVWSAQREIGFLGTYQGNRLGGGIYGHGREEEEESWLEGSGYCGGVAAEGRRKWHFLI